MKQPYEEHDNKVGKCNRCVLDPYTCPAIHCDIVWNDNDTVKECRHYLRRLFS